METRTARIQGYLNEHRDRPGPPGWLAEGFCELRPHRAATFLGMVAATFAVWKNWMTKQLVFGLVGRFGFRSP